MNKLAELIRKLPQEDILLIQRDLEEGNIARVISDRLAELELPQKVCPVCNTTLDDDAPYVLYFGTLVRKKARFDGLDCLERFLHDLKEELRKRPDAEQHRRLQ
jgi:DNA repair exonuclease SbcCD ATPase subunit